MKYKSIIAFLLLSLQCLSQEKETGKTSVSVYGGIEWNTISALKGIELERSLYEKDNMVLGMKLNHAFIYEYSNAALLHSVLDGKANVTSLSSTVKYFTTQINKGFFLQSSLGAAVRKEYFDANRQSSVLAYFDAGFGWQFPLKNKTALRWTNVISFAGKGGITSTQLAVVF